MASAGSCGTPSAITPHRPSPRRNLEPWAGTTGKHGLRTQGWRSGLERGRLLAEQLRQERRVRDPARQATGTSASREAAALAEVQDGLDGHVLIELVDAGNRITAVIATAREARLVDLGPSPDTAALVGHLRFAAEHIARPSSSDASRLAALASADETAGLIRERLIAPSAEFIGSRRAVVIPTGPLHGVPWVSSSAVRSRWRRPRPPG